jgi:hypothetical protein
MIESRSSSKPRSGDVEADESERAALLSLCGFRDRTRAKAGGFAWSVMVGGGCEGEGEG